MLRDVEHNSEINRKNLFAGLIVGAMVALIKSDFDHWSK